jgi:hypothetical protein
MRQDKYVNVLGSHLLLQARKLFRIQDRGSYHKGFDEDFNCTVLTWPAGRPDMNHSVKLWSSVKKKINKTVLTEAGQVEKLYVRLCVGDITENCRTLIQSQPNRLKMLVKIRGIYIYIKYLGPQVLHVTVSTEINFF